MEQPPRNIITAMLDGLDLRRPAPTPALSRRSKSLPISGLDKRGSLELLRKHLKLFTDKARDHRRR